MVNRYISCGVPFAQRGALAALQGPREATDTMLEAYKRRRDLALAILAENGLHEYVDNPRLLTSCSITQIHVVNLHKR
jgi:aspartate/methionine/tyrosine aminotransferase